MAVSILNTVRKFEDVFKAGQRLSLQAVGRSGIAGYVFIKINDWSVETRCEITNNWVQAGYQISTHIARLPKRFTISAHVTNVEIRKGALPMVAQVAKYVGVANQLIPKVTNVTSAIRKAVTDVKSMKFRELVPSLTDTAFNLYETALSTVPYANNLGRTYGFFQSLQDSFTLINVIVPSGATFLSSMAIESIGISGNGNSNQDMEIELRLQEFRVADVKFTTIVNPSSFARGVMKNIVAQKVNKGTVQGIINKKKESILKAGLGKIGDGLKAFRR